MQKCKIPDFKIIGGGKFLFCLCNQLKNKEKQLSLLDKLIFGHIYFKSIFAIFLNINKIAY